MTNRQESRLAMLTSTLAVVGSHSQLWSAHEGLADAVEELEQIVATISETAQEQVSQDGSAEEKNLALRELGDLAYEVAAGVRAYASANDNRQLVGRVDFSRWEITRGRPGTIKARCQEVLDAATSNAEPIKKFNITTAKINALKAQIEAYDTSCPKPREKTVSKSAATRKLPDLFEKASRLLDERIDGLVFQYRAENQAFFSQYQAARAVVLSTGKRSSSRTVVVAPSVTDVSKAA